MMLEGDVYMFESGAGVTVIDVCRLVVPSVAVNVTVWVVETGEVVTVKDLPVVVEGTVTVAGIEPATLLLCKDTV